MSGKVSDEDLLKENKKYLKELHKLALFRRALFTIWNEGWPGTIGKFRTRLSKYA
jgi:hypothetical protein